MKSLKDLEKAIKLCRKLGVDVMKINGVEFHLGAVQQPTVVRKAYQLPEATTSEVFTPGGITEETVIPTTTGFEPTTLTDEQMLFYSAGNQNS